METTATPFIRAILDGSYRFFSTTSNPVIIARNGLAFSSSLDEEGRYRGYDVSILANGVVVTQTTIADFYGTGISVAAGLGLQRFTEIATIPGKAQSLPSNPIDVFRLPSAVDGGIVAELGSSEFSAMLRSGFVLALGDEKAIRFVDGTLGVGQKSNEVILQRLYRGLLGRAPDNTGLASYDVQRGAGASFASIAGQMLGSTEYAALHGTPTNQQFVSDLYQGLFKRDPDADGAASYQRQLDNGVSRATITAALATSREAEDKEPSTVRVFVRDATGTLVNQLFQAGLGRTVDEVGLSGYKTAVTAGRSPLDLAAAIAGSSEFAARHGVQSDTAYVTDLYRSALNRAPDPAGLTDYTARLAAGTSSRADLLLAIATSPEATASLPVTM